MPESPTDPKPVDEVELLERVRVLRRGGSTPKQIARVLGMRPAAVNVLVRRIAESELAGLAPADRELLGCWISPGWSAGLGLDSAPEEWQESAEIRNSEEEGTNGLAVVMVARRERGSRATVCGFLVDVYCMGVKNVHGPLVMSESSVDQWRRDFFASFHHPGTPVPEALAQHVVNGAVAFAGALGLEPPHEFAAAATHLGQPAGTCPIVFGRDGKPLYVQGPHDNPAAVIKALRTSVGDGNYDYIAVVP